MRYLRCGRNWEYLYEEMIKIAAKRGIGTKGESHARYTDAMRQKLASKPV